MRAIQPHLSIYTAELLAISDAITYATDQYTIFTDSKSSIQSLMNHNSKHPIIRKIHTNIVKHRKKITMCWVPSHVGIHGNEKADEMARAAVQEEVDPCPLPGGELRLMIRRAIRSDCEREWRVVDPEDNKLREIRGTYGPFNDTYHRSREWEVKLARHRIGHTRLTHEHLMNRSEQPQCDHCDLELTVKHILTQYSRWRGVREESFGKNVNVRLILSGENAEFGGNLYKFLNRTSILNKI